jgi:hypothetical protein
MRDGEGSAWPAIASLLPGGSVSRRSKQGTVDWRQQPGRLVRVDAVASVHVAGHASQNRPLNTLAAPRSASQRARHWRHHHKGADGGCAGPRQAGVSGSGSADWLA